MGTPSILILTNRPFPPTSTGFSLGAGSLLGAASKDSDAGFEKLLLARLRLDERIGGHPTTGAGAVLCFIYFFQKGEQILVCFNFHYQILWKQRIQNKVDIDNNERNSRETANVETAAKEDINGKTTKQSFKKKRQQQPLLIRDKSYKFWKTKILLYSTKQTKGQFGRLSCSSTCSFSLDQIKPGTRPLEADSIQLSIFRN